MAWDTVWLICRLKSSYSQVSIRHFIYDVKYGSVALSHSIVDLRWVVAYVHHIAFIWVETKQPLISDQSCNCDISFCRQSG